MNDNIHKSEAQEIKSEMLHNIFLKSEKNNMQICR